MLKMFSSSAFGWCDAICVPVDLVNYTGMSSSGEGVALLEQLVCEQEDAVTRY